MLTVGRSISMVATAVLVAAATLGSTGAEAGGSGDRGIGVGAPSALEVIPSTSIPEMFELSFRNERLAWATGVTRGRSECTHCWVYFYGTIGSRDSVYGSAVSGDECFPLAAEAFGEGLAPTISETNSFAGPVVAPLDTGLLLREMRRATLAGEDTVCAFCPYDAYWEATPPDGWFIDSGCSGGEFVSQGYTPCDTYMCLGAPASVEVGLRAAVARNDLPEVVLVLRRWGRALVFDSKAGQIRAQGCRGGTGFNIRLSPSMITDLSRTIRT